MSVRSLVCALCVLSTSALAANLGFEGQPFGTRSFTENGLSWQLTGNGGIRDYNGVAHSGSNAWAAYSADGLNLVGQSSTSPDLVMSVTSLWVRPSFDCESFTVTMLFNGVQRGTTTVTPFSPVHQQVNLAATGVNQVRLTSVTKAGSSISCSLYVDDLAYTAQAALFWANTSRVESSSNVGSIDNRTPATVTLSSGSLTGSNGEDFVATGKLTVTGLPLGLRLSALRTSATALTLYVGGEAYLHGASDSVTNVTIAFTDAALSGVTAANVAQSTLSGFRVTFFDPFKQLVKNTVESAGANCAAGGTRVDVGVDDGQGGGTANNNTLESGEIRSTFYVCNGATGAMGTMGTSGTNGTNGTNGNNGSTALIRTAVEAAGTNCATGGVKVEAGVDNGAGGATANDGVLADSEVTSTQYVCNGAMGATGANGADGADGATGATGATGPAGPAGPAGATGPAGADGADGQAGCSVVPGVDVFALLCGLSLLRGRKRR